MIEILLIVLISLVLIGTNTDTLKPQQNVQEKENISAYSNDSNYGAYANPYSAPERLPPINNPSIQFNEKTRGEESYQLVGVLYNSDINKNYQLFGRRTYPRSNEWEYYILGKDEGGLEFKFPLDNKQEIYDNAELNVPLCDSNFTVKIYDYSLKYNPNVV